MRSSWLDDTAHVDVVAFAAHPDDAEFFCSGTLLQAARAGRSIAIVDLTDGELATNGTPATRATERDRATELLGLRARFSFGLPDGSVGTDPAHREQVVHALRQLTPTIVLAPHHYDRHPDHARTGDLLREACFLAGIGHYGDGAPHRPSRLYTYMLHQPFEPALVIDITDVWDRRQQVVDVYASQLTNAEVSTPTPINDGGFASAIRARARYFGSLIGVEYGEPLGCQGPVALRTLPDPPSASSLYRAYL